MTNLPALHVFIAVSIDGFIARANNGLDFLEALPNIPGEDYGYEKFFGSMDGILMGRNTYDVATTFPIWPYKDKPVVVMTNRSLNPHRPTVSAYSGTVVDACKNLYDSGWRNVYIDGGKLISQALREGLVDEMTLSTIPITLGSGIPLFSDELPERQWLTVRVQKYPSGLVQVHYRKRE